MALHRILLFASTLLLLSGCDEDNNSINTDLRVMASSFGQTGDPASGRSLPDISDPLAQLGMQLFFSKALGGDKDSACVTCHHPALGGGDNLALPIGVAAEIPDLLGPGRQHRADAEGFDGGPTVPRNAPTTFNIGLWDRVLFHDGRIESLTALPKVNGAGNIRTPDTSFGTSDPAAGANLAEAQTRFPVTSPEEMRGFEFEAGESTEAARTHLAARLANSGIGSGELATNNWLAEFRIAFDAPDASASALITYANIATAIAEYERSQVFVDTPWKRFLTGDDTAISADARQGAMLFFENVENGGAGCARCHSGDFFTDEQFHVLAMPQIGRGKGNDNGFNSHDDFGRFRESGNPADKYAFRTPTLLNVSVTGPWSHAGAYTTLEAVVRHHLDPASAVENYDFSQIDPNIQTGYAITNTNLALSRLEQLQSDPQSGVLQPVALSEIEIGQLLEFLHTLTDPCVTDRDCLAPWIPDAGTPNPDGLRLNAVDASGNPL